MKNVLKMIAMLARSTFRVCRYCGYSGGDWPDSDECPACGETN